MKQKTGRKLLSFLLTLAMIVGQMPGMSLTAQAEGEKAYAAYDVTTETNKTKSGNDLTALQVIFNERQWYIIEDNSSSATSGTVTLLSADTTFGTKNFNNNQKDGNKYSTSQVKAYLDSMTGTGGSFASVADPIETVRVKGSESDDEVDAKLWLLSESEANSLPEAVRKCSTANGYAWWLRSPGCYDWCAAFVNGDDGNVYDGGLVDGAFGVHPALKLNLSSVTFSSDTNTFTVGSATVAVTGVSLDKTTAQTIELDGKVSFTATVTPENATDKKVKWSVGGTDAGAVKLYSNEACTTEVGTDATETLTVYAKGISAGSATVTATSNADSEKKASCDVTVNAAQPSTYTLTIPSKLNVANSGWNATTGISATGTLASGKKLTVTASSANSWALKQQDGSETVGYTMKETSDGAAKTAWEFTTLPGSATLGIDVADYSTKPAGTYQDTVTFTAKVEDAGNIVTLSTLTDNYEAQSGDILTGTLDGATQHYKISIADGATVTLKDVNITNLEIGCDWAGINCPGDATLILNGTNTVCAGRNNNNENNYPGIWIAPNKTLTIDGDGSLTAYSVNTYPYGAGIGGGYQVGCGNIVINGGTITATGGDSAAGIGGGYGGACGNITIANTVTKVTATAGSNSPNSIGAGANGTCGTVTIGGNVGAISESSYTYEP